MPTTSELTPILIVDDRPENLLALEAVLGHTKYKLIRANSGFEAIEYLEMNDCAVVLLDVQMPVMDGFETALRIRMDRKTRNIPIIFLTASLEDVNKMTKGYEAGAIDFLYKPFDPEILRTKIYFFVELYKARLENKYQADLLRIQDEQNVNSLLENALDAVIGMNAAGNIIYWNTQATNLFGWSKEEVLGKLLSEVIIPERFRQLHQKGLQHFLETNEGPILLKRIEVFALDKKGNEIPVELTVSPVMRDKNITFTAFVRNISDRKKMEEAMIESKEARLKVEKLAENLKDAIKARDEFIGICSHELRTPITSMKLQFQMAAKMATQDKESVFTKENALKRINLANTQLDRMIRLINDMLDVTKITSGKLEMNFQKLNLKTVLEDVLERFDEIFKENKIVLNYKPLSEDTFVSGDKYRLEQVISNLITNAMKYGSNNPIDVSIANKEGNIELVVEDRGIGITEEDYEKVFVKYGRACSLLNISGLGLGLYITKDIVEAHKGRIFVKSKIGLGSTFTVTIPGI
ncbi:MAG TPA: ATP-binding protein [Bacteriovoracaceae bacterium]|nr:ATP-binding protein [Bacteriovoracaceae bacterium]